MNTAAAERPPLLLIEDDPDIGALSEEMLSDTYRVTLVADGAEGLRIARERDFEAMIIDRRLPSIDGVTIITRLRKAGVATPILMLTALGAVADRVAGLDAGADDYLTKPFDFEELFARLRAIRRVHSESGPSMLIGNWEFWPDSRIIHSPYEGRIVLTETESDLLHLLARHPDQTLSRERILREVFSSGDHAGTVDTYVHYIRKKTERDLITTIRGSGYRLGDV
jgi:two-component system, OmpR family, response regulator QseB